MRGAPIASFRLMDALRYRMKPVLRCGGNCAAYAGHCGRKPARRPKRCVQCSLPCVAMVDIVSACGFPARNPRELTVETMSAKEAKNRVACRGKHLGCSDEADGGLQCGLSGNSVPVMVTSRHGL